MSRRSVVVSQQTAQTLAAADWTICLANRCPGPDEFIIKALMVSFLMIMNHELLNRTSQLLLPEEDHLVQALGFDTSHEPLGI